MAGLPGGLDAGRGDGHRTWREHARTSPAAALSPLDAPPAEPARTAVDMPGSDVKARRVAGCSVGQVISIKRAVGTAAALYVAAALTGHVLEAAGVNRCGCSQGCWCRRRGLAAFRWVFPYGHP